MFTRDQMLPFLPVLRRRPLTFETVVGALFLMAVTPFLWVVGLLLAPFLIPAKIRDHFQEKRRRVAVEAFMTTHFPGRAVADVVAASPFTIGHRPSDGTFRVTDTRLTGEASHVAFTTSRDEAERYILEQVAGASIEPDRR